MHLATKKFVELFRKRVFPLFLIVVCPPFAILVWYINAHLGGSFLELGKQIHSEGFFSLLYQIWQPIFWGSSVAWSCIGVFAAVQLILMRVIPGKTVEGPITPKGNIPTYKNNGVSCFVITLALFYVGAYEFKWFSPGIVYDHLGEIISALNIFSLGFCLLLYFKGKFFPSCSDHGSSGSFIFDYYWGTELYPRFLGWDIKQFTNCRFGMMGWPVIILSYAAKQTELYGLSNSMIVCVGLMLIYIAKFFYWESGYLRSMDIMYDRAGFYICWGCLVWVPSIYASPALYLVNHPIELNFWIAVLLFVIGTISIMVNYFADRQRQKVRATNGKCTVWGKKAECVTAHYTTEDGKAKKTVLLTSGWWGIARHFHYVPEIIGALFWSLPALFTHFMPYFYVVFLTILLLDRAKRDELKCSKKYGKDWKAYCKKVPYKVIPYIY